MKIIEGIKFKELPTFYGAIIEEGELIGFGHFQSTGYWVGARGKHITSYIRLEDKENEDDFCTDAQYERQRVINDEGKVVNFFYIATYDGSDLQGYINEIKAQKEV